jgi:hypothetical protein
MLDGATIQQFWEHLKLKVYTWQEELAELRKLAHRCMCPQ